MANIERPDPPYLQIAHQIRADIESGAIPVGAAVPSARQIQSEYDVATATATKVHAHLRSLGLVESRPGVGTVVRARSVNGSGWSHLRSATAVGKIYDGTKESRITSSELVAAPDYVAKALGLDEGATVVRRERITFAGETPVSKSVSWLPGSYVESAPLLLETEPIPEGTFTYLAKTAGIRLATAPDMIRATTATAADAEALGVPEGSPVLQQRTWFLSDSGQVLEYGEGVNPTDYWLTYEFTS